MIQHTIQVITHKDVPNWISTLEFNRVSRFTYELPKNLNIDFTNSHDIFPYHIVSLACLIEEYYLKGISIKFTLTENYAVQYLRKLDFFSYWTTGFNRKEYRVCEDGTSYCLWQLEKEMFLSYVNHAMEYFRNQFFQGKDLLPFHQSLVELFYNVIDHSQSKVSGYVFTQYFPTKKRFIISLCDFGLGIPTTVNEYLSKNGMSMLTSSDALDKALEEGFTIKSKDNNAGFGLHIISTITQTLKGTLTIISNDAYIMQEPNGNFIKKELPKPFPGTQIVVSLDTQGLNSIAKDDFSNQSEWW